jgi:hypothetical protein
MAVVRWKRGASVATLALILLLGAACYAYRVPFPYRTSAVEGSEVVWSFAWGLAVERPQLGKCDTMPLTYVTARTNLGFTLLTIASLGFVAPIKLEWGCKVIPQDTIIGLTPGRGDAR